MICCYIPRKKKGSMLESGIYEQIIDSTIDKEIKLLTDIVGLSKVEAYEATILLPIYLHKYIEKVFRSLRNTKNSSKQAELTDRILNLLHEYGANEAELLQPITKLNYISSNALNTEAPIFPSSGISKSLLFTGDKDEPSLDREFDYEIATSDSIDFLISFVKFSGLRKILPALKKAVSRGVKIRLITTTYMGATDIKAIEEFNKLLNTEIYVSYDTKNTRLHAKAYIFHRHTGFSTAYVGSSNLSMSAITSGLEWNVKITQQELPETFKKIALTFSSYLYDSNFTRYKKEDYQRLSHSINSERGKLDPSHNPYFFRISPYNYQKEMLDLLTFERNVNNRFKNLIVAATGTGKTVIAAFDYDRLRREHTKESPFRLLFVAHREEILLQSIFTFRQILEDGYFGQILNAKKDADNYDFLFASVRSVSTKLIDKEIGKDFYDMIIIDESHHIAAKSYKRICDYFTPAYLLGLTATPERHDNQDILSYFDNNITAEIRLGEAIERDMLSVFHYFGVGDTYTDYQNISWSRGGYDEKELTFLFTEDKAVAYNRANLVYSSLVEYSSDMDDVKALAFCVTVNHAIFMANFLQSKGIETKVISGTTQHKERLDAKHWLTSGKTARCICAVDVFNEGVDIPHVNTLLFLRPTNSLTIFLQQLGRGLRKARGKECVTVLDFIGNAHKNFRYDNKFSAIIDTTKESVASQVQTGFTYVPKGCYINLDPISRTYVLDNIKHGYSSNAAIKSAIKTWAHLIEEKYDVGTFMEYADLTPKQIYKSEKAFYQIINQTKDENKGMILYRLSYLNSKHLINFLISYLTNIHRFDIINITELEKKYLMIFAFAYSPQATKDFSIIHNELQQLPYLVHEIIYLFTYLLKHLKQYTYPFLSVHIDSPLEVHGIYSRDQIMAAVGNYRPSTMREGVYYAKDIHTDVFLITTDKDPSHYSETTNYEDYAISETLFHWQSQSTTSEASNTGNRYITHKSTKHEILLFARKERLDDYKKTAPYYFLGSASYVSHEGEKPMNIIWRLHQPLSPALFSLFSH